MTQNRLSVIEAAKLMGVSDQFIRIGLQQEKLPFGYAVQTSKNRWTYYISPEKFYEETGIKCAPRELGSTEGNKRN